jgi:hypothetical protein
MRISEFSCGPKFVEVRTASIGSRARFPAVEFFCRDQRIQVPAIPSFSLPFFMDFQPPVS